MKEHTAEYRLRREHLRAARRSKRRIEAHQYVLLYRQICIYKPNPCFYEYGVKKT